MKRRNHQPDKTALVEELAQLRYENSVTRELLSRIVEQQRAVTIDTSEPVPPGQLRWETVETEAGSRETTIWYVPDEQGGGNGRDEEAVRHTT